MEVSIACLIATPRIRRADCCCGNVLCVSDIKSDCRGVIAAIVEGPRVLRNSSRGVTISVPAAAQEFVQCLHCHGFAFISINEDSYPDLYQSLSIGKQAASALFDRSKRDKIDSGLMMNETCELGFQFDQSPEKENFTFNLNNDMPDFPAEWTFINGISDKSEETYSLSIETCFQAYCRSSHYICVSLLDCLSVQCEHTKCINVELPSKLSDLILHTMNSTQSDMMTSTIKCPSTKRGNQGTECILKLIQYMNDEEKMTDVSSKPLKNRRFGLGPHFDFGLLTLIQANHFDGLHIYDRSIGRWISAVSVLNQIGGSHGKKTEYDSSIELLVLPGSQLQLITDDYLPATVHSIEQSQSFAKRTSLIYFSRANIQPDYILNQSDHIHNTHSISKYEISISRCNDLYLSRMNYFFTLHPDCCV